MAWNAGEIKHQAFWFNTSYLDFSLTGGEGGCFMYDGTDSPLRSPMPVKTFIPPACFGYFEVHRVSEHVVSVPIVILPLSKERSVIWKANGNMWISLWEETFSETFGIEFSAIWEEVGFENQSISIYENEITQVRIWTQDLWVRVSTTAPYELPAQPIDQPKQYHFPKSHHHSPSVETNQSGLFNSYTGPAEGQKNFPHQEGKSSKVSIRIIF